MKETGPGTGKQRRSWTRGTYRKGPAARPVGRPPKPIPRKLAEMRPRERLDAIHGMQAMLDYKVRQGELVERAAVEAGHAEMREVIRADLLGTLPLRLAGELADRALPSAAVREVVLKAVRDVLLTWSRGGIPVPGEGE